MIPLRPIPPIIHLVTFIILWISTSHSFHYAAVKYSWSTRVRLAIRLVLSYRFIYNGVSTGLPEKFGSITVNRLQPTGISAKGSLSLRDATNNLDNGAYNLSQSGR